MGKAITLAGDNLDYHFELGRMYFNRGVQSQNLQQQQTKDITAAANKDQEVIAEETLSVNQEKTAPPITLNNDLQAAEAIFKNIIDVSPNYANALYSLGLIYETIGNKGQAKQYYERLLDVVSDQPTKEAILKKLQSL